MKNDFSRKFTVGLLFLLFTSLTFAQLLPNGVVITRTIDKDHPELYYGSNPEGINGIHYNGGHVLAPNIPHIYVDFYGKWTANQQKIVTDFFNTLGGSPRGSIIGTYCKGIPTGTGNCKIKGAVLVSKQLKLVKTITDPTYSRGKNLTDRDIQLIVQAAVDSKKLPTDLNALYLVLTSADVKESASFGTFCGTYCGYHFNFKSDLNQDLKYSFVGDTNQCPMACDGNAFFFGEKSSPNGDQGVDGAINVAFHELDETITDPDPFGGWLTDGGEEVGDLCNFNFGSTFLAPNKTHANLRLGTRDFLVQQMWENDEGGGCTQTEP